MTSSILRRIEDWSTPRRGLAVLAVAAAGMVAHMVLAPGTEALAYASFAGGAAGVLVKVLGERERCEECDEAVYPALRYCTHCGHETGCDHSVSENRPVCPVCGEDR
ncbi:hypothetical protein [Natrinema salinisoli]|uniref:hypothetical protein n=1 Tax=Natrinema salinisoli TaxID=2878535 RepID=UPI001CEFB70D|nr:hypothetical protein [Natrinema salinisoli]